MQKFDLMLESSTLESWCLWINTPLSAEPDTALQRAEFHSKRIYLFWKGVCKAERGASVLLAVNFLAESLLAWSKMTSPAPSFMLGLNCQHVAAALCWYHSRETSEWLQRDPEPCRAPACTARTGGICPPEAGSVQECPSRILSVSFAICPSVLCFLPQSYIRLGGQGAAQWKG